MKHLVKYSVIIGAILFFLFISVAVWAQDKIEIDTKEVGTWFERNWMWVVGALVLIILVAAFTRRRHTNTAEGGTKRTTTVVKDASGNTKSVTTTEEDI